MNRMDAGSTKALAVPTPPASFLHVVQWQKAADSKDAISNRTPPQRQLQRNVCRFTIRTYLSEPALACAGVEDDASGAAGLIYCSGWNSASVLPSGSLNQADLPMPGVVATWFSVFSVGKS